MVAHKRKLEHAGFAAIDFIIFRASVLKPSVEATSGAAHDVDAVSATDSADMMADTLSHNLFDLK